MIEVGWNDKGLVIVLKAFLTLFTNQPLLETMER